MLFLTSDTHFDHEGIIRHCNRPFTSVERMNHAMIHGWNQRVKPTDTVIFVGDFCFGNKAKYFEEQLNGKKVFVAGNHDRNNGVNTRIKGLEIVFNKESIWVTHRPQDINPFYDLTICGHVHEKWKYEVYPTELGAVYAINVGVDQWGFQPVKIDEVYAFYNRIRS